MRDNALNLIQRLQGAIVFPIQTLGELFNVLVGRASRRPARAASRVETSATVIVNVTDLAAHHGVTIRDSVVMAALLTAPEE